MGRWFVNQGDAIRANLISSAACGITVYVTILTPDGEYRRVRSNVPFTTNGTRVAETAVVLISTLPEGEILSMNVATFTPSVKRGQCYVQVYVIEQPTMAQDYVYSNHDVLLGVSVDSGPAGGSGNIRQIQSADPAAGIEVGAGGTLIVPTSAIWRLLSLSVQLVQGITQTPLPSLRFLQQSGSFVSAQVPIATTAISASTTSQLTWGRGLVQTSFTAVLGDEMYTAPIPLVDLIAADSFTTITDGIGANTNYGAATVTVEEWLVL